VAYLILVRHGQTEWNALGLFSGQTDVPLNDTGAAEARQAANLLKDIELHKGYTSTLSRAKITLKHILSGLNLDNIEVVAHSALNERSYGVFEGKSKQEAIADYGEEEVKKLRRAWDHPVPEGETLREVSDRLISYYESTILSDIKQHKNVIVSTHNNTLRAFIKHLESLSAKDVETLELKNAEVRIYEINDQGKVVRKETRSLL
jgi:2,3-bisphosphoglycerate-dependent phosphoglycerate mutase